MYPISLSKKAICADLDGFPWVGNPDGVSSDAGGDSDNSSSGGRTPIDVGTADSGSEAD